MVDKFGTLGSMITSSFGYLSLDRRHEEKNDLLRNYSHFLQIAWNILLIWHNYDMFILLVSTFSVIFGVSAMLGFFSFFKLLAALRRPEEWWFRYQSAFP